MEQSPSREANSRSAAQNSALLMKPGDSLHDSAEFATGRVMNQLSPVQALTPKLLTPCLNSIAFRSIYF
jgi:hypothetical protein